jgi:lysophospholipase L1-like esterase
MKMRLAANKPRQVSKLTTIRIVGFTALFFAVATISAISTSFGQDSGARSSHEKRVALWGSSVANGAGDESGQGGYANHIQQQMAAQGWELLNLSRNGDNTVTIRERFEPGEAPKQDVAYLTSVEPAFVIIGLSLGNEGITQCQLGQAYRCTSSMGEAQAVFDQFADGLQELIARVRAAGITPVVTLPYARSDFWEREYSLTRRMNLLINSWDVPSINILGAVDDGQGRWARGLWSDPFHPNAVGHEEIAYAFVPSLFPALQAGKEVPQLSGSNGYAQLSTDRADAMSYNVDGTMRSFALTFGVRPVKDGPIAAIRGQRLDSEYSIVRRSYGDFEWDSESLHLTPASGFESSLRVESGRIAYLSSHGDSISTPIGLTGDWNDVTLVHYAARGETLLYVDGEYAGSVNERLQPASFILGGTTGTGYRQWMIHRSALNGDEVRALHSNTLLQASLEIYAPLGGDNPTENRAQSLSVIRVDPGAIRFGSDAVNQR